MAAAYAALISLFNNLELIQNHPRHSFHFEDKQIESLRQSVCSLIDFMESCDYDGEDLERRIASAAHAAEDVLESHVVDQIHSGSTLAQRKTRRFLLDLQEVIENMDFVRRKAMQVKKAHGGFKAEHPPHSVSSTPLISEKSNNTMVGFEDVSLQLLDLLTGESSSRKVIPILGMGVQKKVCPPELEDIGKKIVKKCKGLPLAIVVVGGHLGKSSRMQEYWEKVANNFNSILDSGYENERCLDMLSLSYSYLPVQLKPLFIYMATFDEDEEIDVSELIQLWVAEGFIKSNSNSSEEVAEHYLKDLIERNLIIADSKDSGGKIVSCEIHDLLREVCLKIAEKEKFFHHVLSTPRATHLERRVLIVQDPEIIQAPISAPTVRSLKCQEAAQLSFDLRLVRVQNRVGRALTKNEDDGGFLERNLQHVNLRYLRCYLEKEDEEEKEDYDDNLNDEDVEDDDDFKIYSSFHLPPSISRLWNLQTLIVEGDYEYVIAPYEIWEMPQLRHLQFYEIFLPDPHPCHSFDQPLGLRNVGTVANVRLSEEFCRRIPDIKALAMHYYDSFRSDEPKSHYSLHNLGHLHKLEMLGCKFSGLEWRDLALSLTFPSSLKELWLINPPLQWEELTMMLGFLPHLHTLYLKKVKAGPEWNPVKGGFPNLKLLSIRSCPDLICWNADNSHFPVLEELVLKDLSKLDKFPYGLGEIPTLEYIELKGCSASLAMFAMRMLVEQEEEQGNYDIELFVDFRNDLEKKKSFEKQMEEEGLKSDNLYMRRSHSKSFSRLKKLS